MEKPAHIVTLADLLRAVGEQLQRARLDRKWTLADVERHGGPTSKTVQAIENGEAKSVESLNRYARAMQLSIVDVLSVVYGISLTEGVS